MQVDYVHFECSCQEALVAILIGRISGANTCPKCRTHIVVQTSDTRSGGVAVFINPRKHRPSHTVMYQTAREWHRDHPDGMYL